MRGVRERSELNQGLPSGLNPLDHWEILKVRMFIHSFTHSFIPLMFAEYLLEARYFSGTGIE